MRFTEEQQSVIDARGCDLLVSAAAGSGKTAVLVERIFSLLTKDKIDADRLLVVTFTRAAALEMRERIRKRIEEALLENPSDALLHRQETLLARAQITTIDAFCQEIVRNHFTEIDVDPQARVADEGERRLLMADAAEEVLRSCYEKGEEDFLAMADAFCAGATDDVLGDLIISLHEKAMGFPFPESWLSDQRITVSADADDQTFSARPEIAYLLEEAHIVIGDALKRISEAFDITLSAGGPYPYDETLSEDISTLKFALGLLDFTSYDKTSRTLHDITWGPLKPIRKKPEVSPVKKGLVMRMRNEVKSAVRDFTAQYFSSSREEILAQEQEEARILNALIDTTIFFLHTFAEKKRERNLMDFSDMEHFALRALVTEERTDDGKRFIHANRTAREYRDFFREIMVDEYQDVSMVQEMIIQALAGTGCDDGIRTPRFMVGDVKQSIYRFRLARPEIFMKKLATYSKEEGKEKRRIDLHKNFRSGGETLHGVNTLFSGLMAVDLGGVDYDDDAFLRQGSAFPGHEGKKLYDAELLCGTSPEGGTKEEAELVALKIKELMRTMTIKEGEDGERPVRYGDIAILLRAQAGRDETFRKVLEAHGIPVYVESRTGYFSAWEVQIMLQTLSALNNPLPDIPFVTMMHAPTGGFSDSEIARIRAYASSQGKDDYFSNLVRFFAQEETLPEELKALQEKCGKFLAFYDSLRKRAHFLPVHELMRVIMEESGFLSYVSAMPDGRRRAFNLEILTDKARDYEKTSYRGLARFIGYIDALKKFHYDEGEANLLDENADVVRIMSIHKSKGLEFPVVFACGMKKQFNLMDVRGDLLVDADLGIGISYIRLGTRIRMTPLKRRIVAMKILKDTRGEEMRLLYVAMTRAREKLILTASGAEIAEIRNAVSGAAFGVDALDDADDLIGAGDTDGETARSIVSYIQRNAANSYLKWMLSVRELWQGALHLQLMTPEAQEEKAKEEDAHKEALRAMLFDPDSGRDEAVKAHLRERFSYVYPHGAYRNFFAKTTVTELKEALLDEEDASDTPHPYRHPQTDTGGAARGTLYHKVMELLPDTLLLKAASGEVTTDAVETYIAQEIGAGRLDKEAKTLVRPKDIATFLSMDIARRMGEASARGQLYREKQFMIGVPATSINESLPAEEITLIQGIIDCYFEEDGALVLLDYKTDRVREASELVHRYQIQLKTYAQALTQITGKAVKECVIYSFALEEEIRC